MENITRNGETVTQRVIREANEWVENTISYSARIRLGDVVPCKLKDGSDGTRPNQLDYFVFDQDGPFETGNKIMEQVKAAYGTDKPKMLRVRLVSQFIEKFYSTEYKMYSKGKWVKCRGDGVTAESVTVPTKAELERNKYARARYDPLPCGGENCEYYQTNQCQLKATFVFKIPDIFPPVPWGIVTSSASSIKSVPKDFRRIKNKIMDVYPKANLCLIPLIIYRFPEMKYSPMHPAKMAYVVHIEFDWDAIKAASPPLYAMLGGFEQEGELPQIGMDALDAQDDDGGDAHIRDLESREPADDTTPVEVVTKPGECRITYGAKDVKESLDTSPVKPLPTERTMASVEAKAQASPLPRDAPAPVSSTPYPEGNPLNVPEAPVVPPVQTRAGVFEDVAEVPDGPAKPERVTKLKLMAAEIKDKDNKAKFEDGVLNAIRNAGVRNVRDLSANTIERFIMDAVDAQHGTGDYAPEAPLGAQ